MVYNCHIYATIYLLTILSLTYLKKKIHVPSKYTPKLERSGLNEELSEMENLQKFKKYH